MKACMSPLAERLLAEYGHEISKIVMKGGGTLKTKDGKTYQVTRIPTKAKR